jgi:predicted nucleic acid-binding protein
MIGERVFVDTNILVYAYDNRAQQRHDKAVHLVDRLWRREFVPVVSVQVLQELCVNLLRKGVTQPDAARIVTSHMQWS